MEGYLSIQVHMSKCSAAYVWLLEPACDVLQQVKVLTATSEANESSITHTV